MEKQWLQSRKAAKALGLHPNTLRKYADNGTIPTIKNAAGQRLYDVDGFVSSQPGFGEKTCPTCGQKIHE